MKISSLNPVPFLKSLVPKQGSISTEKVVKVSAASLGAVGVVHGSISLLKLVSQARLKNEVQTPIPKTSSQLPIAEEATVSSQNTNPQETQAVEALAPSLQPEAPEAKNVLSKKAILQKAALHTTEVVAGGLLVYGASKR